MAEMERIAWRAPIVAPSIGSDEAGGRRVCSGSCCAASHELATEARISSSTG